ncbi:MAG: PilZ domain-containing protein [Candidatus Aminicenantes bacterium]|nr:PilZ domain-containing protein [Candidatus Aminicenantes bacterium]
MVENEIENRACVRFEVPGATVIYQEKKLFSAQEKDEEEFWPVLDMSRGGFRFLCQKPLKSNTRAYLKISIPGESAPMNLTGQVRWTSFNPGKSYKYQIGVQFNPYGEESGQNSPENLERLIALENKFTPNKS